MNEIHKLAIQFGKRNRILKDRGMTFRQFLDSKHWKKTREYLQKIPEYQQCVVCSSNRFLNFHHTSYRRMFTANLKISKCYIVALCSNCHNKVHDMCQLENLGLGQGVRKLKKIYKKNNLIK